MAFAGETLGTKPTIACKIKVYRGNHRALRHSFRD
jgi:hypothetical protein